jgi:hypothetical protein
MAKPHNEWRHLALLISILILFLVTPLAGVSRHGALIMNGVAAIVLATASYALIERRRLFALALALSGISIITSWLLLVSQQPWVAILSHVCVIVLIAFFSITTLDYVLRGVRITMDKIFAAVCVYMLIGYEWTFLYALLDLLQPGAFIAPPDVVASDYVGHVLQMRYFSFTTLTTVGYGDIVPHSGGARTLASLEAVTGQLYLTVLVARLVGLHIVHGGSSRKRED